jgi:hypothetical protein
MYSAFPNERSSDFPPGRDGFGGGPPGIYDAPFGYGSSNPDFPDMPPNFRCGPPPGYPDLPSDFSRGPPGYSDMPGYPGYEEPKQLTPPTASEIMVILYHSYYLSTCKRLIVIDNPQELHRTTLRSAAVNGDTTLIERLLSAKSDVNGRDVAEFWVSQ